MNKIMVENKYSHRFIERLLFGDLLGGLRFLIVSMILFIVGCLFMLLFGSQGQFVILLLNIFRFSLIPLAAMGISLIQSTRYLQDIYEIEDFRKAVVYLWICIFEFPLPKLKISGGKKEIVPDEFNYIERIAGPGKLEIEPGNAVVLETLEHHTKVVGNGSHRISRFETIKDVIPLEEQFGEIGEIVALTRDGIEVAVRGVQYRFCVDVVTKDDERGKSNVAYSFSKRAVINLAYQRAVGADHHLAPWINAVQGVIRSIITDHISNTELDALVAPHFLEGHPLDELRKKFDEPRTRDRLKGIGARLIACNIGELVMKSGDIDAQLVETWFAKKEGISRVIRAQGESENFISQERGRAEGQAMLLKNISRALQEIELNEKTEDGMDQKNIEKNRKKNLRNILLARTAQILESRTSIYQTRNEESKHDNKG
jgi:hypothetical protein